MKKTFLDYYRENLAHIRELSGEFAADFPKIAARLDLSSLDCADPYTERLLEGTAFLTARVEKKMADGYYPILESILASSAPFALFPVPAGAVFEINVSLMAEEVANGVVIPAGTILETQIHNISTPVRFTTLYPECISTVEVVNASYLTKEQGLLQTEFPDCAAALQVKFSPGAVKGDLNLFLKMSDTDASELFRQQKTDLIGVVIQKGNEYERIGDVTFDLPATKEAGTTVLKDVVPQQVGPRLASLYFNYPDFFRYISVKGLPLSPSSETNVLFLFRDATLSLKNAIKTQCFKTNCVPALNLFGKRSERIAQADQSEYPVVLDRSANNDYEIYTISQLNFFDSYNRNVGVVKPFYSSDITDCKDFFVIHRKEPVYISGKLRRSSYFGSEVNVSFSGENLLNQIDLQTFTAETICTNRDLPLLLNEGDVFSVRNPIEKMTAVLLTEPTAPRVPLLSENNQTAWKITGHLLFNLSSALAAPGKLSLKILRDILNLYYDRDDHGKMVLLSGIKKVESTPQIFRFIRSGAVFFESGWHVVITLDEANFAGCGIYFFAEVLCKVLMGFTPMNSFLEMTIVSLQRGRIGQWSTCKQN